jgi:ubiquinone/menaquinone biosynthesis C-methylase UbiE
MNAWILVVLGLVGLAIGWIVWRVRSRRALLPCPSEFRWLVELENPIARVTRSERVVRHLAPLPGARVIDVGCGPGRVTLPLARAVGSDGEVVALDVQPEMLTRVAAKAAAAGLPQVHPLAADARHAGLSPGSFDGAVLVMALGEIPEDVKIFAVLATALRPGGRLLVAESIFDPHYVRREKVRSQAAAAGLVEQSLEGNGVAYSLVFAKPG